MKTTGVGEQTLPVSGSALFREGRSAVWFGG